MLSCRELPGHLDSEAVVAQEDVADPRDKDVSPRSWPLLRRVDALEVVEAEEEAVSRLAERAQVLAGVVVDERVRRG